MAMKKALQSGTIVPQTKTMFLTRIFKKNTQAEPNPRGITTSDKNTLTQEKLVAYRKETSLQHLHAEDILKVVKRYKKKPHSIGSTSYEIAKIVKRTLDFKELQVMMKKQHEHFTHEIIDFLVEKKIHPHNLGYTTGKTMLEQLVTFYKPGEREFEVCRRKIALLFKHEITEIKDRLLTSSKMTSATV
jgi:mevalonate kinase